VNGGLEHSENAIPQLNLTVGVDVQDILLSDHTYRCATCQKRYPVSNSNWVHVEETSTDAMKICTRCNAHFRRLKIRFISEWTSWIDEQIGVYQHEERQNKVKRFRERSIL
jgi:DNA-directed RNA polymerase subunit RPC12/RpoP